MFSIPIHVIDFEGSRQSGIVEYGIATLSGCSISATYTRICAPVGTISDFDRAQHGIHEKLACLNEPFHREWSLFSGLREDGPFAAHNKSVEAGLLCAVWPRPRECVNFAEQDVRSPEWGPWLDTLQLYRRIYPGLGSYGLEALLGTFGLQERLDEEAELLCPSGRRRYHCALYDAIASALLLSRLLSEPELKDASLRWLIQQSASSEVVRQTMEQQEFQL